MNTTLSPKAQARIDLLRSNTRVEPVICVQKMKYMTESFKETEGYPIVYRRAKALDKILTNLDVVIGEGELIVGRPTSKARGGTLSPEINASWYLNEMDTFATREEENYAALSEEEKDLIRECVAYWSGKSLFDHWQRAIPEDMKAYNGPIIGGGGFCLNTQYYGHICTDFERIVTLGVKGILAEVDEAIASFSNFGDIENFEKTQYLEAMKISLNAVVKFANRYADEAERMAAVETDAQRKAELETIASNCRWVPENPARTFHEAIQAAWFMTVALENEAWGAGPSVGRVDQYLYPFYKADKEAGRITDEDALELLSAFFIKENGQFTVYSTPAAKLYGGLGCRYGNTIAGLKPDGSDAVNELSYLCLDASLQSYLTEDFMILISTKTPKEFISKAVATASALHGKMKFCGCDVLVKQMLHDGRPIEMANNCAITGCNSPSNPGTSLDLPGGMINMMLMLDLVLHNGYSPMLKKELGLKTGDPRDFKTFDEFFDAWKKQFAYFVPYMHLYKNMDKKMFAEHAPCPLQSSMMQGCIQKGLDITNGGMYPYMSYSMSISGAPDMGDSLYAIKKLVFEDKKYTMAEMLDALDANWEGYDEMLHQVERLPKFGNDQDCVDSLVNEVISFAGDEIGKYPGFKGAKSTIAVATITGNIPMGGDVGATPDGRHAGEPISEGGISPHQGRNISGLTATMASVGRLNYLKFRHGSVLNLRIDPEAVKDQSKIDKLATLISSFHAMGGYLVQFNVVSTETLRDAQLHPEDHRDLLVRVSTYSAYFVELSKALQDDIICRLEFNEI